MLVLRPWLVIPAIGIASAGIAAVLGETPEHVVAVALLGAALAAAIRAFVGPSGAAAVAAGAGALLGVLGFVELGIEPIRSAIAGAAGMFAVCELARPKLPNSSPLPAVGAALVAGVLDPSYVALIAVAGVYLVVDPWPRPRWVIALPIAGVLATGFAIAAACVHGGVLARLWAMWTGPLAVAGSLHGAVVRAGDLLGPLTAVAALAGLAICATRGRFAASAVGGVIGGTLLVGASGAAVGPALPILAALGAGIAIGRLAALIRMPMGQTFLGATTGFVMLVVPAYSLLVRA